MSLLGRLIGILIGGPLGGPIGEILTRPPYSTPSHVVDPNSRAPRQYGDVMCAARTGYLHFGICSGDDSVIHFTDNSGKDISSCNEVIETDYATFKKADKVFVLSFPEAHDGEIVYTRTQDAMGAFFRGPSINFDLRRLFRRLQEIRNYKLYSPEETVQRARSRLGQTGYDLVKNNCEHFAIWCKTGIHESHQVNELLNIILRKGRNIYDL